MNNPKLILTLIASAFLFAGGLGLSGFALTPRRIGLFDAFPMAIGIGLLMRMRIARIAALVYCALCIALSTPFLWVVLSSIEPRTFTFGTKILPPAVGYLIVIGYLGCIAVFSGATIMGLLSKTVKSQFEKGALTSR